jgi:hypothetical protein
MRSLSPAPRFRHPIRSACALALVLGAGALTGAVASSAAAPADNCVVLPLSCPTISTPTIPPISVPLPTTPAPPTTTAPATQPPAPGDTTSTPAQTSPTPSSSGAGGTTAEAFSYTVTGVSARRSGPFRWIDLHVSLSHDATVVAVLHRSDVPTLVAVRTGRAGENRFAVAVPARVRAGRYELRLVFGTGAGHQTITRRIAIPR